MICLNSIIELIGRINTMLRICGRPRRSRVFATWLGSSGWPPTVKEFPRNLKRDERLARAGSECEQDAHESGSDGLHHPLHGDVLIVAAGVRAAFVFARDGGEAGAPRRSEERR